MRSAELTVKQRLNFYVGAVARSGTLGAVQRQVPSISGAGSAGLAARVGRTLAGQVEEISQDLAERGGGKR